MNNLLNIYILILIFIYHINSLDKEEKCNGKTFSRQKSTRCQSIIKQRTGKEALLTLDGGGIRGLILTEVLLAIECVTNESIFDLFDWISGTSTGSYLALSLATGKYVITVVFS